MQCSEPLKKMKNSYKPLLIALISLIIIHLAGSNASGFLLLMFTVSLFIGITRLLLDLAWILFKFAGPILLPIALGIFIYMRLAGASDFLILVLIWLLVIGIPCLLLGFVLIFLRFIGASKPGTGFKVLMNTGYYLATIIISVVITAILLNFIPIQFAVKLDDAKKELKKDSYICETYTSEIGWIARFESMDQPKFCDCFKATGSCPEKYLSWETFDFKWYEVYNRFVLVGDPRNFNENKETGVMSADLNVREWQIIYPIKRATIIQELRPKGYLVVYDYDWIKIIKSL